MFQTQILNLLMLAQDSTGQLYIPIQPCRLLDTRLSGQQSFRKEERREIKAHGQHGKCNIPKEAQGLWVNVTILPLQKPFGFITVYRAETTQPEVSLMNSLDGSLKSNAAIVGLSSATPDFPSLPEIPNQREGGGFNIYVTDPTHVLVDVSGYFVGADSYEWGSGLWFVKLPQPGGGFRYEVRAGEHEFGVRIEELRKRLKALEDALKVKGKE